MKQLLLASAALLGLTTGANATLTLSESVNGGLFGTVCTGNPACSPGFTFTDSAGVNFLILGASSNSPGTLNGADVTQAIGAGHQHLRHDAVVRAAGERHRV